MGVPKRRTSKMRLRTRKAANRWQAALPVVCSKCGAKVLPHTVCSACGYYKGRLFLQASLKGLSSM